MKLRVASFNLATGANIGIDESMIFQSKFINKHKFDIVFLQEVRVLRAAFQIEALISNTNLKFHANIGGNAILSKLPLFDIKFHNLPLFDGWWLKYWPWEPPIPTLIEAKVIVNNVKISLLCTHYHARFSESRRNSTSYILDKVIPVLENVCIFGGDLNAGEQDDEIKRLTSFFQDTKRNASRSNHSCSNIDYIFKSGPIEVDSFQDICEPREGNIPMSDHPVVVTDFFFPDGQQDRTVIESNVFSHYSNFFGGGKGEDTFQITLPQGLFVSAYFIYKFADTHGGDAYFVNPSLIGSRGTITLSIRWWHNGFSKIRYKVVVLAYRNTKI